MTTEDRFSAAAPFIRRVRSADASAVAELMATLGYPSLIEQTRRRITAYLDSADTAAFVAEVEGKIAGVISFHCVPMFHAEGFLGRITSMVVATDCRQKGIGRLLVDAAEKFGRERGCTRFEVTSGDHRADAHAFYERLGYRVDCRRFLKTVG